MNAPWWLVVLAFVLWLMVCEAMGHRATWPGVVSSLVVAAVIALCVLVVAGCVNGDPVTPKDAAVVACAIAGDVPTLHVYASRGAYGDVVQDSTRWECAPKQVVR